MEHVWHMWDVVPYLYALTIRICEYRIVPYCNDTLYRIGYEYEYEYCSCFRFTQCNSRFTQSSRVWHGHGHRDGQRNGQRTITCLAYVVRLIDHFSAVGALCIILTTGTRSDLRRDNNACRDISLEKYLKVPVVHVALKCVVL